MKTSKLLDNGFVLTGSGTIEPDYVRDFVNAWLEVGEDEKGTPYEVQAAEAYRFYDQWCWEHHYQPVGRYFFYARMAQYFRLVKKRPPSRPSAVMTILGCRFCEEERGYE